MQQLQYDSFYKFLVSAGITLIIAPIALLFYLVSGDNAFLITQEEMAALSTESAELAYKRLALLITVYKWVPVMCIAALIIGLILIGVGCYKWWPIQKKQDERLSLEVDQLDLAVRQMTTDEVDKKNAEEVEEVEIDKIRLQLNENTIEKGRNYVNKMLKYEEIENKCFQRIYREKGEYYLLRHNVCIDNDEIDILAIAKNDGDDLIYEVKYWVDVPSLNLIETTVRKVQRRTELYSLSTKKTAKPILMIVTTKDNKERIKSAVKDCQIEIITEDEDSLN